MKQNINLKWILIASVSAIGILVYTLFFIETKDELGKQAVKMEEERHATSGNSSEQEPFWKRYAQAIKPDLFEMEKFVHGSESVTPLVLYTEYKLQYRYPPDSRPLTKKMEDLIHPFRITQESSILNPDISKGEIVATYTWNSPSSMITGDQSFIAWLEVIDTKTKERIRPRIRSAEIYSDLTFGKKLIGTADFNDSGSAPDEKKGDNVYTFSWQPRIGEKLHWGELTMKVIFDAPNLKEAEASLMFQSTPNPPANFRGTYTERLQDGSLILGVEIDVRKPGQFVIEGNLFDKQTGEAYHWVYVKPYLEAGPQVVDLKFFGTVFHDRGFEEGRLILKNLRGHRLNFPYDPRKLDKMMASNQEIPDTHEPYQEWMAMPKYDYVTQNSYDIVQFSKEEYKGRDKEERLRVIQDYATDWEKAHGAGPDTIIGD